MLANVSGEKDHENDILRSSEETEKMPAAMVKSQRGRVEEEYSDDEDDDDSSIFNLGPPNS